MTPESVDELAALQRQILDTVHTYVKPNGVLVYSTCTIDEAENEDNVRWFIEKIRSLSWIRTLLRAPE